MVVHFWVAVYSFIHRDRFADPDVAVELAPSRDIRDKDDNILAGNRFVDTVEDFVRRISQKAKAVLWTSPLGALDNVA
jgi:hypothetical protein